MFLACVPLAFPSMRSIRLSPHGPTRRVPCFRLFPFPLCASSFCFRVCSRVWWSVGGSILSEPKKDNTDGNPPAIPSIPPRGPMSPGLAQATSGQWRKKQHSEQSPKLPSAFLAPRPPTPLFVQQSPFRLSSYSLSFHGHIGTCARPPRPFPGGIFGSPWLAMVPHTEVPHTALLLKVTPCTSLLPILITTTA